MAIGLARTSARNASQRRIASSTGVGPSTAASRAPADDVEQLAPAARACALSAATSPGRVGAPDAPRVPRELAAQQPRPALAALVAAGSQDGQGGVDDPPRPGGHRPRLRLEPHELALDLGACPQARLGRPGDRLVEDARGVGQAARLEQRRPERRQQLGPRRLVALQERRRALEQARARGGVAAQQRGVRRGREPLRRGRGQGALVRPGAPELGAVAVGLAEVVADRLVLDAGLGLEPARDALVQLGAPLLGQARGTRPPG